MPIEGNTIQNPDLVHAMDLFLVNKSELNGKRMSKELNRATFLVPISLPEDIPADHLEENLKNVEIRYLMLDQKSTCLLYTSIAAGACYQYAKEAMGDNASYLKLGMVNPLPVDLIKRFAAQVDTLYVIEELDDIIETHCVKHGVKVIGKELFPRCGEFNQQMVRELLTHQQLPKKSLDTPIPVRPPVMCCGCPHRGLFYALKRAKVYAVSYTHLILVGVGNAVIGSLLAWMVLARRTRECTRRLKIKSMPQLFEMRYNSQGIEQTLVSPLYTEAE